MCPSEVGRVPASLRTKSVRNGAATRTMATSKQETDPRRRAEVAAAEVVPDGRTKSHEPIGGRLREARLRSGFGVRELSRQLDISASSISQIELDRVLPSVSTLYALTNALNISMDSLFVAESHDVGEPATARDQVKTNDLGTTTVLQPAVTGSPATAHERSVVLRRDNRSAIDLEKGVRWELLTPVPEPGAEFLEVYYPVGGSSSANDQAIRHNGRDYCLILEGSLRVQIGFEQYVVGPGDSLAFDGTIPHRLWNVGNVAVRAVWFVLDRWPPHSATGNVWGRERRHETTAAD